MYTILVAVPENQYRIKLLLPHFAFKNDLFYGGLNSPPTQATQTLSKV